jgi:hypothetical protein
MPVSGFLSIFKVQERNQHELVKLFCGLLYDEFMLGLHFNRKDRSDVCLTLSFTGLHDVISQKI